MQAEPAKHRGERLRRTGKLDSARAITEQRGARLRAPSSVTPTPMRDRDVLRDARDGRRALRALRGSAPSHDERSCRAIRARPDVPTIPRSIRRLWRGYDPPSRRRTRRRSSRLRRGGLRDGPHRHGEQQARNFANAFRGDGASERPRLGGTIESASLH